MKSFTLFCLVVSCVLGVGFFTGQEVLTYFGRVSVTGILCAAVSSLTFFFLLQLCLKLGKNKTYEKLCGKQWFKIATLIIYAVVGGAMLAALRVVCGGFAASVAVCIVGAVFAGPLEKIFGKLNYFFCAAMIVLLLYITTKNIDNTARSNLPFVSQVKFPFLKAVMFSSFNLFLCAPFLSKMGGQLKSKQAFWISASAGSIMFILIVLSMFALGDTLRSGTIMPFLGLSGSSALFIITLCLSATTTLFGIFVSAKNILRKHENCDRHNKMCNLCNKQSHGAYIAVVCATLTVSLFSFDSIISVFYVSASVFALYFFVRLILFSK